MKPTEFELEVCNALISDTLTKTRYNYLENEFYPFARNLCPFFTKTIPEPKPKKLKKIEEIKFTNRVRLLGEMFNPKKNIFNMKVFTVPTLISSDLLEIRALCFIYFATFLLRTKPSDMEFIFSIIVSFQRFIAILMTDDHKDFSSIALNDMKEFCDLLVSTFNFSGTILYEKTPMLITSSSYDVYLPKNPVEPYQHQSEVINTLKVPENILNGFVHIYSTATNSGKTFSTVGIANKARLFKKQLIFCCAVESVRQKVYELMSHSGITVHNHISTDDPFSSISSSIASSVLVCTPRQAKDLLYPQRSSLETNNENEQRREQAKTQYILFIDEITINSSDISSPDLDAYMQVFSVAPKWVYISNANLPVNSSIDFFIEYHRTRFPNAMLNCTTSNTIYSCSSLKTFTDKTILPHMGCKTLADLKECIRGISCNQFKGRMYNPKSIGMMANNLIKFITWSLDDEGTEDEKKEIEMWKAKIPDVNKFFSNVTNLHADNIRKIAMDILNVMVEFDDDYLVEKLCLLPLDCSIQSDTFFENIQRHIYKYQDVTLVAHPSPVEFAKKMFGELIKTTRDRIGSVEKIQASYDARMVIWQKQYDRICTMKCSEVEKCQLQEEMKESTPTTYFPDDLQINTKAFLKKMEVPFKKCRTPINLLLIDTNHIRDEDLLLLLYMGIGVYTSTTNSHYREKVLEFASEGRLEFIVSDVCYGMDYPIGCLLITKEFSDKYPLNALYQLICRVGRGRMSHMGQVFMEESCASKILDPTDNSSQVELGNMNRVLSCICND